MFAVRRRRRAARFGMVVMATAVLAALALPAASAATSRPASPSSKAPASHTTCVTNGVSTTCTGTASGDNAYNPWAAKNFNNPTNGIWPQISHPPVVTVSQTKDLTDQIVNVSWQYFTPSLDIDGNPNSGGDSIFYEVSIYECKGTNPTWDSNGLADSCFQYGEGVQGPGALGNAVAPPGVGLSGGLTYAPGACGEPPSWGGTCTNGGDPADWKGSAQFHIETGTTNSFLGCDVHSPCSLVLVPNFGGNYALTNTNTDYSGCGNHYYDNPLNAGGENNSNAFSYDGACGIMDRIVVPLSFAPTPTNCPANVIQNPEFHAEGSPMMARQMTQWQTAWCRSPAGSLNFSSVSEDSARTSFLGGGQALGTGVDMALTTLPASGVSPSSRKFTYAPLANSGAAIAYYVDDGMVPKTNPVTGQPTPNPVVGQQINRLVLDPELVAKLTTESYALNYGCNAEPQSPPWSPLPKASDTCDPAVAHNTQTLFLDPEFLSLNKNCQPTGARANYTCGLADFETESNLGSLNLGVFLPTMLAPPSDMTYQLTDWVGANAYAQAFLADTPGPGMHVNTYYKGTSYPAQQLFEQDPGVTLPASAPFPCSPACSPPGYAAASMQVAWNFVVNLGQITQNLLLFQPNADNPVLLCENPLGTCTSRSQYGFSHPLMSMGYRDLFSEMDLGDVGAYLFPAAALVNATGNAVAPTQASVEATVAKDMSTNPDGITQYVNQSRMDPAAYPLTMVDYAMVPTCGLRHGEATAIADFLDNVATTGQKQGVLPGQLQPGYYPLTSAQRAQTLKAAAEVKSQDCKSVPPDHTVSGRTPPSGTSPANSAPGPAKTAPSQHRPPSTPIGHTRTAAFGQKSPDSGLAGILLVLAIVFGALLVLGGPTAWVITVTGRWPVVLGWVRAARARSLAGLGRLAGLVVRRA